MSDIGKSLVTELDVIKNRKANPQEGSYTSYLFSKGVDKILKKVGEEATEVIIAAKECPVTAISEGDGKYVIDADTCIECGACAGVCPVGAPAAE